MRSSKPRPRELTRSNLKAWSPNRSSHDQHQIDRAYCGNDFGDQLEVLGRPNKAVGQGVTELPDLVLRKPAPPRHAWLALQEQPLYLAGFAPISQLQLPHVNLKLKQG